MGIYGLLRKTGIPVWLAAICGGGILLLYGVMVGMSVSACRAIGMYLLKMLAEVVGRTYDMLTALGVMALIVVWSNPGYLHNAGFYLSFGAVLGIGVLYPSLQQERKVTEVLRYETHRWKQYARKISTAIGDRLRQSILSGLSVTLMTLPIQLWFYYEVPTYSIFLNLLVIPFMSTVMICGLLAMLIPGLGILGTVDCLILGGYEWLCNCFEKLPFHKWNPGKPGVWQIVIYYALLLGSVAGKQLWENRNLHTCNLKQEYNAVHGSKKASANRAHLAFKSGLGVQVAVLTVAVAIFLLHIPPKTILTFLDVGQGDCICVQLESGEVYLFDCGSTSRSKVGEYVLMPYLKYYGIHYIDAVFVSHSDADHCSGIWELLQQSEEWGIEIGQLVLSDMTLMSEMQAKVDAVRESRIKVVTIEAGDYWEINNQRFWCLHPPMDCDLQDANAYSQCFYLELGEGVTILLTGDVEAEGEELLLEELKKREMKDVTILKVSHHGSRYSTGEAFLEEVCPEVAVISCGENNNYGHPHKETLERLGGIGAKILSTAEYGALRVENVKGVKIYGFMH